MRLIFQKHLMYGNKNGLTRLLLAFDEGWWFCSNRNLSFLSRNVCAGFQYLRRASKVVCLFDTQLEIGMVGHQVL
jgi:hypothetical protein